MENENLIKIKKINVGKDKFKRVEIYVDVLNNNLIFIGLLANSTTGIRTWETFTKKTISLKFNDINSNFKDIINDIYLEMVDKEKTIKILKSVFKDVESIDFN